MLRKELKREAKALMVIFVAQKVTQEAELQRHLKYLRDEASSKNEGRGTTEGLRFNIESNSSCPRLKNPQSYPPEISVVQVMFHQKASRGSDRYVLSY